MNNENIILLYYFNEIVFSLLSFFTPLIIWKHNYIIQLFNEIIFLLCIFIRTPSSNGKFRCITVLYNRIVFHENDCFRKKKKRYQPVDGTISHDNETNSNSLVNCQGRLYCHHIKLFCMVQQLTIDLY